MNPEGQVDLAWSTISEQDDDEFIVQRTPNASEIEDVVSVPSIAPNGNSVVSLDYEAVDEDPLTGTSYYRLLKVDLDTEFE